MTTATEEDFVSDESLIMRVRAGDRQAYGELWRRHSRPGLRAAQSFRRIAEPEDVVAEAFTRILRTIEAGKGPTKAFRPYLYTVIKNVAVSSMPKIATASDVEAEQLADPRVESLESALEKNITVTAYRSLPERWRTVLWYTEIERMKPAQVAELIGLSPNAVSALASRARSALRSAWLQAHVNNSHLDPECRDAMSKIGEYVHGSLSARDRKMVDDHLDDCTRCPIVLAELQSIGSRLALVMLPLIFGVTGATALIRSTNSGAANLASANSLPLSAELKAEWGFTPAAPASSTPAGIGVSRIVAIAAGAAILLGAGTAVAMMSQQPSPNGASALTAPSSGPNATPTAAPTPEPTPTPKPTTPPPPPLPATPAPPPDTAPPVVAAPPPAPLPILPAPAAATATLLTKLVNPLISGTGVPGATVLLYRNGVLVASVPVDGAGVWQWTATGLNEGNNALSIVQSLAGYQDSANVPLSVTIDTIAPAAPVVNDTWSTAGTTKPGFSGTAEPGATVTLRSGGTPVGTAIADATGAWSVADVATLTPTTSGLTAVQTDPAGNTSAPATVGPFAFVPGITDPVEGAVYAPSQVAFTIHGWPGANVRVNLQGLDFGPFTLDSTGAITLHITGSGGGALGDGNYTLIVSYYGAGPTPDPAAPTRTVHFSVQTP